MIPRANLLTLAIPFAAGLMAWPGLTQEPAATGSGVRSDIGPPLVVSVSSELRFVDRQRFVLLENSDAEQHVFVDSTDEGSVRRLAWIQFEAYLPGAAGRYDYSSSQRRIEIDGFEFYADSAPRIEAPSRPGSDAAHLARLLHRHGLRLPQQRLWQRLVHVGEENRSEVMVIYLEDLAPHGISASDLVSGPGTSRWPAMAEELLRRARGAVRFTRRD
jgi:hypothetical protein